MSDTSSLSTLPFELLSQIVSSLDHVRSLSSLSKTCRRLHDFVERDGWHAFTLSHFPKYSGPPQWRDAAHSLASLARSWDRRAFNARFILPQRDIDIAYLQTPRNGQQSQTGARAQDNHATRSTNAQPPPRDRFRRQGGQTMGYHPVLDCTEHWTGGEWTSREETLAIGAGAEVILRKRQTGASVEKRLQEMSFTDRSGSLDDHGHRIHWMSLKEPQHTDGLDDVSALKLLRKAGAEEPDDLIIGRVSGGLERMRIGRTVETITKFATNNRCIRAMDISEVANPLMAVGLGAKDIGVYNLDDDSATLSPAFEFSALCQGQSQRVWSTRFLDPTTLAVGYGNSETPLDIYGLRPDGASEEPLRRFRAERHGLYGPPPAGAPPPSDAVYSIAPLAEGSRATNSRGQVFLSGWYSGSIRLHDMRSPHNCTVTFADPLEAGAAVYSLLPMGMNRFMAGSALHAKVQVFDLRRAGAPAASGSVATASSLSTPSALGEQQQRQQRDGYNLFLARDYKTSRRESSVYSLASASAYSPTIYAGLEGSIMQIDVFASADRHPDPVFRPLARDKRARDAREKHYASLAMMDYEGKGMLYVQRYFGSKREGVWDDRWLQL